VILHTKNAVIFGSVVKCTMNRGPLQPVEPHYTETDSLILRTQLTYLNLFYHDAKDYKCV